MLDTHEPGNGQMAFKPRKRGNGAAAGGPMTDPCTSHFLLGDAQSALHAALRAEDAGDEGDLNCPKCRVRVGSYSWYGQQCACGAWVTPAIQVVKSKVDEAVPAGAALAAAARVGHGVAVGGAASASPPVRDFGVLRR